ncbi:glycoside hydrolase family 5 protein [Jaapia argillacea MUCL 33604]|uniref:cellulase n=1 Tax=Jaapia argillacea MUCL 33604 TaxID=933084 RepID=A0A067PZF0_9AGAM|nr:glycoside hydrolase family 5 protein [Jaapia argillacea MUCL 33604]
MHILLSSTLPRTSPTNTFLSVKMKLLSSLAVVGLSAASSLAQLAFHGVNIAGFDFGCATDGYCNTTQAAPPLLQYGGSDGYGQMLHFVQNDGYNIFRLPVGWQYLTNNVLGGVLYPANFEKYYTLVQTCLSTGAYCIVDIHNYARWNGTIIGQGGPTNEQFAAIWYSLASQFKYESRVVFGVMNEPHDIPDVILWAGSVQAAVTAIRTAGATSQLVLLPGNDWTSAATIWSDGSGAALLNVTNPAGDKTGLIIDVHKYLDYDNSGTHANCTTNNTVAAWEPLSAWLRANGRQALNTETGGGNTASCVEYLCQQRAYQQLNADVILGYVGWAAGGFATDYVLSEVPVKNTTTGYWTDTWTVEACLSPRAFVY